MKKNNISKIEKYFVKTLFKWEGDGGKPKHIQTKTKMKNITLKKPEQRKISQTKKFFKDNIRGIVPKQRFLHLLLGDV